RFHRRGPAGGGPGIGVEERDPARAALQRPPDADVVAPRPAVVAGVADELHPWMLARDQVGGPVRGRVVDDYDVHAGRVGLEGGETAGEKLGAVPVDDDRGASALTHGREPRARPSGACRRSPRPAAGPSAPGALPPSRGGGPLGSAPTRRSTVPPR